MPGGGRLDYMYVELQGVRTLVPEEGVAYIEFVGPLSPSVTQGLSYIKVGRSGNANNKDT